MGLMVRDGQTRLLTMRVAVRMAANVKFTLAERPEPR
jgi:hypothetical protein